MKIQDLIPSVAIDQLLAARDVCGAKLDSILQTMRECDALMSKHRVAEGRCLENELFSSAVSKAMSRGLGISADDVPRVTKRVQKHIDAAFWECVLHRSGMRTHLSATLREQWDKSCRNAETVPFEYEYLVGTFGDFMERKDTIVVDAVVEVFRRLSWQYKTNSPVAFGKRLFLAYMHCDGLDDLERALHVLDKKPPPEHRTAIGQHFRYRGGRKFVETDYFTVQTYLKGSAKVTFLRLDLVDKLNGLLARRYPEALPPPARGGMY